MRRSLALLFAVAPLAACTVAQGDGDIRTEDRPASDFIHVEASGSVDVEVYGGAEATRVQVTCDGNLQSLIEVEVQGTTLHIHERDRVILRPSGDCFALVEMGSMGTLATSGSADLFARGASGLAEVQTSGSGDIDVAGIDAAAVDLRSSGSGDIRAGGVADALLIDTSGSGGVDARALVAESVRVRVSGSGDVEVSGAGAIDARTSGSGDVHIYGDVGQLSADTSGSGDIVLH